MNICKRCGKEHEGSYKNINYCSSKCLYGRVQTEEANARRSKWAKEHFAKYGYHQRTNLVNAHIERKKRVRESLLNDPFETLIFGRQRKRLLLEQDYKCAKCGISEWFGYKISLEIHHIDGNKLNNSRENVVAICPNCHSITPTWRGRNASRESKRYTDQEVYDIFLKNNRNTRQTFLSIGYAAKSGNYTRMQRVLEKFEPL